MKNLLSLFCCHILYIGFGASVQAQTSVHDVQQTQFHLQQNIPRFIESIELLPESIASSRTASITYSEENASIKKPVLSRASNVAASNNIENCTALQFKYAVLADREVEDITNIDLFSFIDEWWGTRYRYGGKDKRGIDCSAFTGKLWLDVYGITLPRTAKEQYGVCTKIWIEDLVEGDLVFFNTSGGVSHVGVYLGNNKFVHSGVHGGVTISDLKDKYYESRFISGGRITE
ncbi:MAG: C40 family peptidase [Ferruginibacter sp.]